MKIEIWSDIMCPFCYIGKRKFEQALKQFSNKEGVVLDWKSFQLMPELKTLSGKNMDEFLAEHKEISLEEAKAMNRQVIEMAKQVGLVYNFDIAIPANTFNAHRFIHFAKQHGKQNEAEEILFRSYFTDGKNINDYPTLIQLGEAMGLDRVELNTALENGSFANDVNRDIYEARQIGVRGVPFFVFNGKYGVSGAQAPETFLETLENSFAEWRTENPESKLDVIEGQSCTPQGECD
ncbi:MAG TPA: DsbA family oxidoreductase [Arachidicoccus sp.]|nr:DsbA family oxidoreductase [Arachidicoccus sp.]